MSSDPLADMLTKLRNANLTRKERIDLPSAKMQMRILEILQKEGFIKNYKYIEDRKQGILRVYLEYGPHGERVIRGIRRASRPGGRRYISAKKIPRIKGGEGISILSTPRGIITDEEARSGNTGGEILCQVW